MRGARIIFAALIGATACSSTRVTSTWQDSSAPSKPIKKVLVVGVVREEVAQRKLEEHLVSELMKRHIEAVPSYRFETGGEPLSDAAMKEIAARDGFDAVLVSRYVGTERELDYRPNVSFNDYLWSSGYYDETENVKLETGLFSTDGRLLWAASTSTIDPSSIDEVSEEVAQKIVERLDEDVVI